MTQDVLIEEIISSFWEDIYFELFSFSVKRAARRECDILLTSLTMEKLRICCFSFVLYSLSEKKKSRSCLSLHSFTTDSNSLYENYKAINSFPKYSICRKRTLELYLCSQSTEAAFNESRGVIFSRVKFLLGLCIYATVSKLWEAIAQRFMQTKKIG